ncbi:hypothetical protein K2173_028207 [Erythroxylum novogranatense]|uniref:RING-type domain-containing protein n=1 Tax=Erythroxylum novogranatense TaxID=1862640 RepID=A0AAV8U3U4_9ROSI|nr:hypothetical protein K2173_028207 [Erythroxylum novogranatense]
MSILPTQTQGSTSSSSVGCISGNPSFPNYGTSPSRQFQAVQSSPSQWPPHGPTAESLAPAAEDHCGASEKVTKLGTPKDKSFSHLEKDMQSVSYSAGQGVGSAQSKGKMPEMIATPDSQQTAGSINSHGSGSHSAGKRAQMMNANHLLNFHFDPIERPQSRAPPPPRRYRKIKPYNKDLFLQANYKFVVLDTGDHTPESLDPDKMLRWEDIVCVNYSTPFPVQCPICLEYPLCPQITSCGHIFCFPCILQYLLMGETDHKCECFKRCPLCFVMISQKDLYTINIENVKEYNVGDTMEFLLLTRQKDSFSLSQRNKHKTDIMTSYGGDVYDPFSKFTFTSDVELSVRNAMSDLDSWLAKADSGLVDDLGKLPYVCVAMELLEQKKKCWNEQKTQDSGRNGKQTTKRGSQGNLSTENATNIYGDVHSSQCTTPSIKINYQHKPSDNVTSDVTGSFDDQDANSSSSYDESKSLQRLSNGFEDVNVNDSYNFYQAFDGQHLILHPLNMKCLLHHYGNYDMLPPRISGKILQFESVTQSETTRRRYRFLSHFSLTTTFQLCEIDLSELLPPNSLLPFMDEIKKRERQRKQIAKKEQREKIKAEVAAADSLPILSSFGHSFHDHSPNFTMDDFEALGNSVSMSSSPPVGGDDRILFANVARLGFAAGHDSPALRIEETNSLTNNSATSCPSGLTGPRNSGFPSFANIISREKSGENLDIPKVSDAGKKGKKTNRVLLSTAGARRY